MDLGTDKFEAFLAIAAGILVLVAMLPTLHCVYLQGIAMLKARKLRAFSVEINTLLLEEEHLQKLYSELVSLDDVGRLRWLEELLRGTRN